MIFYFRVAGCGRAFGGCLFAVAIRAACRDLQVLRDKGQAVFFGDGTSVPVHERGVELKNFIAIRADDVSFESAGVARAFVVLKVASDVEFAENSGANQVR